MKLSDAQLDLLLKAITAATTTIIAIVVAIISHRQWKTAREKLRLDLYDRRFKIYLAAMQFHIALTLWDDSAAQEALIAPFIQASREAKFLFPASSGIYNFLQEFAKRAFFITNFKQLREMLTGFNKELNQQAMVRADHVNWILTSMEPLEVKMAPFLNFHEI